MGKGGQQSVGKKANGKKDTTMKLEHMPVEELRKWANAYGIVCDKDKDALLKDLVRINDFMAHSHIL